MTTAIGQEELLRRSAAELERIDADARELTRGLEQGQLDWAPPEGGWSISQVFDHLATANSSYFEGMRQALRTGTRRQPQSADWKPSFFGGMLIRSLEPSARRGLPSPRIWRPSTLSRPGTVEAFLQSQATLAGFIREAQDLDLMRTRLSSPVSRLIRMNLGDAIRVLVVHGQRHLGQVERVLARPGFPRPDRGAPAQPPQ